MSIRTSNPPGRPFWVAHLSPDAERAKAFYGALFGWTFENVAAPGAPPFYVAAHDDVRVASLTGPQDPAVWITAVTVRDLDQARRAAAKAGGRAPGESVDITTLGRFHRLHDTAGAEIHVVEPESDSAPVRVREPMALSTIFLNVSDPDAVARFYETVFGWQLDRSGPTETFRPSDIDSQVADHDVPADTPTSVIAVVRRSAGIETSVQWTPGFQVLDTDTAVATTLSRGGQVIEDATVMGLRTVALTDPEGASFAVIQQPPVAS